MFNNKVTMAIVALSMLALCLSGCGNTYSYNGKSYSSAEDAHAGHIEYLRSIEAGIVPVAGNPSGRALLVTPSQKTCEALGVTRKGHAEGEIVQYIGKSLEDDYSFFLNFLNKGNVFKTVTGEISDFPRQRAREASKEYDATIYLDMQSASQVSWVLISPPDNKPKQINMDSMAAPGAPKIQSWINDVHNKMTEVEQCRSK